MNAFATPAPRRITLPRVKFKRPRWPKGSRLWLMLTILSVFVVVNDAVTGSAWIVWDVFCMCAAGWLWWYSRRDDDGPSAT